MTNALDIVVGTGVELVIFGFAGLALQRLWAQASFLPQRQKLMPFNRGVIVQGDVVERVVEPGYRWLKRGRTLVPVDIRKKPFQVPIRELITADNGAIRIAFGGEYRVIDPALYITESADPFGALFVALERVIPSAIVEFDTDTIVTTPTLLAERVKELIEPRAMQLGMNITELEVSNVVSLGWVLKTTEL
jgi:regulator of protease activity HflC (stomatin/prohibitin superfamily)